MDHSTVPHEGKMTYPEALAWDDVQGVAGPAAVSQRLCSVGHGSFVDDGRHDRHEPEDESGTRVAVTNRHLNCNDKKVRPGREITNI